MYLIITAVFLCFHAAVRDVMRETRDTSATGIDGRESSKLCD